LHRIGAPAAILVEDHIQFALGTCLLDLLLHGGIVDNAVQAFGEDHESRFDLTVRLATSRLAGHLDAFVAKQLLGIV